MRRILLVLAGLGAACAAGPEDPFARTEAAPGEDGPDPTPRPEPSAFGALACPDGDCVADAEGLTWTEDLGAPLPCPLSDPCPEAYLALPEAAAEHLRGRTLEELLGQLDAIWSGLVVPEPGRPPGELAAALREALDAEFLLAGIEASPLAVRTVARERLPGGVTQETLALDAPWVGEPSALLLLPPTPPPWPGVVAHPGHWEGPLEHRDLRHGLELAEAGAAVLLLDPRANDGAEHESEVTLRLLLAGGSFLAVRLHELLLGRRLLRAHPDVHPDFVGATGHSGGAAIVNLALRAHPEAWFAAATDFTAEYVNVHEDTWLDETAPAVHPWHEAINDFGTAAMPVALFEYGYPDGPDPLVEAFAAALEEAAR